MLKSLQVKHYTQKVFPLKLKTVHFYELVPNKCFFLQKWKTEFRTLPEHFLLRTVVPYSTTQFRLSRETVPLNGARQWEKQRSNCISVTASPFFLTQTHRRIQTRVPGPCLGYFLPNENGRRIIVKSVNKNSIDRNFTRRNSTEVLNRLFASK